ncbi:Predicted reductase RutE in novel pyrimidine catabolism pathway [uncultured Candidatus Thioglobus sp.]|nr:Predicted reductase RutE in novel pyrimidine catabolism pathway [uncultured Candidatus Thioglobus sp.]SMN00434.1 Predicted reductase RutE in novel pyrimidine catabolism pathway [uncultured Candidatus Thioglobus sp.]
MLNQDALNTLFTTARSHNGWLATPVSEVQIKQIYELMKFGATAANTCPARLTFITSDTAKNKLKPHLDEGNIEKSMSAPVVAIISYDTEFYEKLDHLFPHTDAKSWYQGKPEKIKSVGEMNATLQGAYLMLAARAVGLDCGPMGGFNAETLDQEFFPDGKTKTIFICGIGHGDESKLFPRSPRLSFDEACHII